MDSGHPKSFAASNLPIMQDDRVSWNGQPVAVVVAETLEQAEHAASLVRVVYDVRAAAALLRRAEGEAVRPPDIMGEPTEITIGDADKALADADAVVDDVYRTPPYNHNAIEPHATIAVWTDDGSLTRVRFDADRQRLSLRAGRGLRARRRQGAGGGAVCRRRLRREGRALAEHACSVPRRRSWCSVRSSWRCRASERVPRSSAAAPSRSSASRSGAHARRTADAR